MAFEAIPQPTNYGERLQLADRTRDDFDLRCDIVVDAMDDRSRALFGDQPNSLILIGPDGVVRLKQPWADPDELEAVLPGLLKKLAERLATDAAKQGAPWTVRVAAARASGDRTERSRLSAELTPAPTPSRTSLLLGLDSLADNPRVGPKIESLRQDAVRAFADRPAALRAFLAKLVDLAPEEQRGPLLDQITASSPAASRTRAWVRASRSRLEDRK